MTRWIVVVASALGACSTEEGLSNIGTPGPPEPSIQEQVDVIVQAKRQQVDVLWVVDNSCSMADDQDVLAESFVHFIDWFIEGGLDFHLGVITTDPQVDRGILRRVGEERWISPQTEDPVVAFREMARVGTDGTQAEAGLWSTWLALDGQRNNANVGFLRSGTSVHTIVVSDEDDHTPEDVLSLEEFLDFYGDLRQQPDRRTFSSIVSTAGKFRAHSYLEATDVLGGSRVDIGEPGWVSILDELGRRMTLPKFEFFLSRVPTDDEVEVDVFVDGEPELIYEGFNWEYDRDINAIRFIRGYPDPGAEVHIRYRALVVPETDP